MALASVDVAVKVKGGDKLDQLIKRMDKLEKESDQTKLALKQAFSKNTFSGITQGTTSLTRFSQQTIKAQRELDKLKKTGASVQALNIGVSGATAAGAGAGAAAAGGAVALSVQAASKGQQELNNLTEKYAGIQDKLNSNLNRQAANQAEIDELARRRPFVEGQTSAKIKQSAESLAKQKAELSSIDQKLKALNASQRGLIPFAERYEKELADAGGQVQKTNNRLTRQQTLMKGLQGTISRIGKGFGRVGNLVAGAGLGLFAKSAFNAAANVENLQARTKVLTTEFGQLAGIEEVAAQSADRLKLANSQVLRSYIDLGNRLGEQGTSLGDIQQVYEGLNTVLVKNKASTQEAASATLQLNQALGAGKLAGDEYRSINEATPQVISEIAKVLGVARGQVKGLAADGLVSSKVVIQALTNINKKGAAGLEAGFTGAFGATREFNKALIEFREVVGTELLPALTPLIKALTELLKWFGQLPGPIKTTAVAVTALGAAALIAAPAIGALGSGLVALGGAKVGVAAAGMTQFGLGVQGAGAAAAFALNPFTLLAVGAVAIGTAAFVASKKIQAMRDKMNDTTGTSSELKARMTELQGEIKRIEGNMDGAGNSARGMKRKVDELRVALENLEGEYKAKLKLEIIVEEANAATRAQTIEGFDTLTDDQIDQVLKRGAYAPPKPTGGGGSGPTPRESQVPQLKQELEASQKLLEVNRQLLDAQLAEDAALVQQLEATRILTEYENSLAAIALEKIPAVEKELKGKIALNEAMEQQAELANTVNTGERDRLATLQQTLTGFDREVELAGIKGDLAKALKQIEYDIADKKKAGLLVSDKEIEDYRAKATAAAEINKELTESQKLMKGAFDIVSGELTNAIGGLIDGTKEWGDVLSDILSSLGKMFLNAGFNSISGSLFPKNATGGVIPPNSMSMVGEQGPELVTTGSSPMRVTNASQTDALAKYGPGNNSGNGNSQPVTVNYNGPQLTFDGNQYISRDALPEIINTAAKQGAKLGEANTFRAMRNRRSTRQSLGI